MKKTLIQVNNLDDYICKADSRIFVDSAGMILTPGAKDALRKRGIALVYGPCPEAASCTLHAPAATGAACSRSAEKLLFGIATVLKEEYGITDLEQLRRFSLKAVETIQKNL